MSTDLPGAYDENRRSYHSPIQRSINEKDIRQCSQDTGSLKFVLHGLCKERGCQERRYTACTAFEEASHRRRVPLQSLVSQEPGIESALTLQPIRVSSIHYLREGSSGSRPRPIFKAISS